MHLVWIIAVYLDYLSLPSPCWILFADRRPTLALRITLCLAPAIPVCCLLTLPVLRPCVGIKPRKWIRTSPVLFAPLQVLLLLLKYIFSEKTVLLLRYCGRRSSCYFTLMQYKLKIVQFIPNAPSTFLWAMSDAHSRMIHSFESILFKGLSKPVNWPTSELFVQFPAARAELSEAVLTQL